MPASTPTSTPSPDELDRMDAWWRAANYLSVGQVYLLANPLLRTPLKKEDTKPRLLGHWGTVPGLNFIYVHLNRIIRERDSDVLFIAGPGHGAPGVVANSWLKAPIPNAIPMCRRPKRACSISSSNSRSPAAFPAMPRRKRRNRSMKAANWAIRSAMPLARCSTIPI